MWRDNGASATACTADSRTIDVVAVSAPGKPADLPAGACTLIVDGVKSDDAFKKGTWTASFAFNVDGTKDAADPFAASGYVLPEQCGTTMMMPDAAAPMDLAAPVDASAPLDGGTAG